MFFRELPITSLHGQLLAPTAWQRTTLWREPSGNALIVGAWDVLGGATPAIWRVYKQQLAFRVLPPG